MLYTEAPRCERSTLTREEVERTEISDIPAYLEKAHNAALIAEIKRGIRRRRMRESGRAQGDADGDFDARISSVTDEPHTHPHTDANTQDTASVTIPAVRFNLFSTHACHPAEPECYCRAKPPGPMTCTLNPCVHLHSESCFLPDSESFALDSHLLVSALTRRPRRLIRRRGASGAGHGGGAPRGDGPRHRPRALAQAAPRSAPAHPALSESRLPSPAPQLLMYGPKNPRSLSESRLPSPAPVRVDAAFPGHPPEPHQASGDAPSLVHAGTRASFKGLCEGDGGSAANGRDA